MKQIQDFIEQAVRPRLREHGGDIEFLEVTPDMQVKIRLLGACATCPGAQQTLSEVVEYSLKQAFPEVKGVVPVFQVNEELLAQALAILRKKDG